MKKIIFILVMMISFVTVFSSCSNDNDETEYIDVNKEMCVSEWKNDISLNILPFSKIEDKCNEDIDVTYINKENNHHVLVTYTYEQVDDKMYMSARINDSIDIVNVCEYIFTNKHGNFYYSTNVDNYKFETLLNTMYKVSLESDFVVEEDNWSSSTVESGVYTSFLYKDENGDTCSAILSVDDKNHIGQLITFKNDTIYKFFIQDCMISYSYNMVAVNTEKCYLTSIVKEDFNNYKTETIYNYDYNKPQELDKYFMNHPYSFNIAINYYGKQSYMNMQLHNSDKSYINLDLTDIDIFNIELKINGEKYK